MRLAQLAEIAPSTYNPRTADPMRLDLIALSLRKLGFLLPIYATPQGEIMSGHQRHYVCSEMLGWEAVPLETTPAMNLPTRKAVNLVFNRATNDMERTDVSAGLTAELLRTDVDALAAALPDKTGDERFPCLRAELVSVRQLVEANSGSWNQYAFMISKALVAKGIRMPIVARRSDLCVINGVGRLQTAAMEKMTSISTVWVSDAEAALAEAMLNLLTMDFNLHERYADVLRFNSFRRPRGRRKFGFGIGMSWPMGIEMFQFDIHNTEHVAAWRRFFGDTVLDFGAGQREDTRALRYAGITADEFEPYPLTPGTEEIDRNLARQLTAAFLAHVASGRQWTSIFLSAVLNSVPFHEDRRKIVALVAALCGPHTTFYTYSSSVEKGALSAYRGRRYANARVERSYGFQLGYEPNVTLGEIAGKPKMQKYWYQAEFEALMSERFLDVRPPKKFATGGIVAAICRQPRPPDLSFLRQAIEFEFDMPYPDGQRMGMVDEALDAFSARLGANLREAG